MSRYEIFDGFVDAVLVIDADGVLHYGNEAAALIVDVSARRLSNGRSSLSQFLTFEPNPIGSTEMMMAVEQATQLREVTFQSISGKTGLLQVFLQPQPEHFALNEESKKRWILYMRDTSLEKTLQDKYHGELDKKDVLINELREARAKLEEYSQTLEKKVEERTLELSKANRLQKTILDSLAQGILVFDNQGSCLPVYSKVCRTLFEDEPSGRAIEDVLQLRDSDRTNFEAWREAVFNELLDFEDMAPLGPKKFKHARGLEISLEYNELRSSDGALGGVVMVATDRTQEVEAQRKLDQEKELVNRVTQVSRNREAFRLFVKDAGRLLEELTVPEGLDFEETVRSLHTLKGGAASFGLMDLARACHDLEDEIKKLPHQASGVPVPAGSLNEQARQVIGVLDRELVSLTELLGPIMGTGAGQMIEIPAVTLLSWSKQLSSLGGRGLQNSETDELRVLAEQIHREATEKPVASSVQHLGPSLFEVAKSLGRKLEAFLIEGGETKVPVGFAQPLLASLVHAFRNSVYHGLESPDERRLAGKPEGGTIRVVFERRDSESGPALRISIHDDGRGVSAEKVRDHLIKNGKETLASESDYDVIQNILRDDVSTSSGVNLIAGRGVGLAAIAAEARRLGGKIVVYSDPGKGMRLEIDAPLSLRDANGTPSTSQAA